jgi:hypothetical protein
LLPSTCEIDKRTQVMLTIVIADTIMTLASQ